MPEIVIPLRHLSQALNILGNILYTRNDIYESKIIFERACPLVELVPNSIDEKAADACFMKLKDVYKRIYEDESVDGTTNSVHAVTENDDSPRRGRRNRRNHNSDENKDDERNNRTDGVILIQNRIRQGQIYDLLKEINVYDSLELENQHQDVYSTDELFNADNRINELRSPYDHIRAELLLGSVNRQQNVSPDESLIIQEIVKAAAKPVKSTNQHLTNAQLNMEPYYDIPSIRRYANYDRERSKLMFYNIIALINNFISEDSIGKNMLLVNVLNTYITPQQPNEEAHPIYKSVAEIMSNIIKDNSFDECYKVLSDFFDLTGLNKGTFVRGLNEIEARGLPISAETQWRLLVIFMFDKAYDDPEASASLGDWKRSSGRDSNRHKNNNEYISDDAGDKKMKKASTKGATNFDFEKFADEPVPDIETVATSSTDSLTYLSLFFLFIIILVVYGIYQESQRKRPSSTRSPRHRKSSSRNNSNDIVSTIYSVLDTLTNNQKNGTRYILTRSLSLTHSLTYSLN